MNTLWGDGDSPDLSSSSADEEIERIIDEAHPTPFEELGEVTVYEYKQLVPERGDCGLPLIDLLEALDEEFGNPGEAFEPTEKMIAAEQAFMDAVLAEYVAWRHEQTGNNETVNALEWVREHRPDWIAERKRP